MKKEKIAKSIFWLISIILIIIGVYGLISSEHYTTVAITWVLAILANPKSTKEICRKIGAEEPNYMSALLPALIVLCLFLSFAVAMFFTNSLNSTDEFAGVFKLSLYTFTLIIIEFFNNSNRKKMYIIFSIVYIIFTAITISNGVISNPISSIMNKLPSISCKADDIIFICDNMINPIKEGILTYIILEVIKQEKDNEMEQK